MKVARLAQQYKICPICRTPSHRNAAICATCGATLADVEAVGEAPAEQRDGKATYDARFGETDLFEGELRRKGETYFLGVVVTAALLAFIGLVFGVGPWLAGVLSSLGPSAPVATDTPSGLTAVPTRDAGAAPPATNTPRPTLEFDTVTPAPPTATLTPTQGPCVRTVEAGDDLLSLAYSCGHRHLDVVAVIVATNALSAPEAIQIGQVVEIPWPTPTIDPNLVPTIPTDAPVEDDPMADGTLHPAEAALRTSNEIATATLQAGVMWHRVAPNENIVSIAFNYGANVEILSQLNPEVRFSQCDFGSPTGGPNCIVQIYAGQLLRVPAPTPTPTIPPTPSGSETPTPSPTPTFNAPSLTDPGNRSLFERDQLVTLRWVTSGTLGRDDAYLVTVEDTTAGVVYTAETTELFFIVPEDWQGTDGRRHEYRWQVSVIEKGNPDNARYTTEARLFSWEGRAGALGG